MCLTQINARVVGFSSGPAKIPVLGLTAYRYGRYELSMYPYPQNIPFFRIRSFAFFDPPSLNLHSFYVHTPISNAAQRELSKSVLPFFHWYVLGELLPRQPKSWPLNRSILNLQRQSASWTSPLLYIWPSLYLISETEIAVGPFLRALGNFGYD